MIWKYLFAHIHTSVCMCMYMYIRIIDSFITFIKVGQQAASRITSPQPYNFHDSLFSPICLVICVIRRDIVKSASVSAPSLFLPLSPGPALCGQTHHTWQDIGTGRRVL